MNITLGFTGDVMLGRLVNEVIQKEGYRYPWGNTLPLFKEHDFTLINLETTLTRSKKKVPKVFNFKADPLVVQSLVEANIQAVTLANNHCLDFSENGLQETLSVLDAAKIAHIGAGLNLAEAKKPLIVSIKDIQLGILAYTDNESGWLATEDKPGTNYISIDEKNLKSISEDLQNLRKKVDILIVTLHWGPNNREVPSLQFQNFARGLIDLGVDIVHGHSAHVTQGIERYKNKLILYDTGDFVDDYQVGPLRNDYSFLFQLEISKQGIKSLRLIPVIIEYCQVNLARGEDFEMMTSRIKKLSKDFGTELINCKEGLFLDFS